MKKWHILEYSIVGVVFVLAAFLLLWNLGGTRLNHWDEAWYAAVSHTMFTTNNYFTPMWNTAPFFEKPPLYYWLTVINFYIFGVSDFSVRLTSAIAGIATLFVVYQLGKELGNRHIGIMSVSVLLSSSMFLYRSRTGNLDSLLLFWMTLALYSFVKGLKEKPKWFLIMGISLGLGFLTKGFIAIYLLLVIAIYTFFLKDRQFYKREEFLQGLGLAALLIVVWSLLFLQINGQEFIRQFLQSNEEKFNLGVQTLANLSLTYLGHLKSGMKLWSVVFAVSMAWIFINKKIFVVLLPILYTIIFFVIMSFSSIKSNWFIMPIYVSIAIITSYGIYTIWGKLTKGRAMWLIVIIFFGVAVVQIVKYKHEYFTPDVARDDAQVALYIKDKTKTNENIYLTNYYYPSIVYYAQRKVYAVYSDNEKNDSWWILPRNAWNTILKKQSVMIITTKQELDLLRLTYREYMFIPLFSSGEKMVVKKV